MSDVLQPPKLDGHMVAIQSSGALTTRPQWRRAQSVGGGEHKHRIRRMDREDDEIRFALGVLDDHRRLIAAGKTHRWDIVKWAVTINVALAGASVTLRNQSGNATELFWWLALGVVILSVFLMWEITRRMTATRNDSRAPEKFLSEHGINFVGITGKSPSEEYKLSCFILLASAAPALALWLL